MSEYIKSLSDEQVANMRDHFYKLGWGQNETMWECWNQALDYIAPQLSASQAREAALREKLEAAEAFSDKLLNDGMQWKQRAEAAEARIKASQEQEPRAFAVCGEAGNILNVATSRDAYGRDDDLSELQLHIIPLYKQPTIPPELAELQRQVEFWKTSSQEWKLAYVAIGGTASEPGKEELRKLLESKVPEGWQLVPNTMTEEMGGAFQDAWFKCIGTEKGFALRSKLAYEAALAAAPQPKEPKQ